MNISLTKDCRARVGPFASSALVRLGLWLLGAMVAVLPATADVVRGGATPASGRSPSTYAQHVAFAPVAVLKLCAQSVPLDNAGEPLLSGASTLMNTDVLLRKQTDAAEPEAVQPAGAGTFLLAYDGLHPKLEMFDGSNYQGLLVTFNRQKMRSTSAALLYGIETGAMLVKSVAAVKPQPAPTGVLAQPATSPAALGGGLLLFCLLGYRRRTVTAWEVVSADAFNLPESAIKAERASAPVAFSVTSSIYNRVLKISKWAVTPSNRPYETAYDYKPARARRPILGLKPSLIVCKVRGNAAQLTYASRISLLLMRTSGRD